LAAAGHEHGHQAAVAGAVGGVEGQRGVVYHVQSLTVGAVAGGLVSSGGGSGALDGRAGAVAANAIPSAAVAGAGAPGRPAGGGWARRARTSVCFWSSGSRYWPAGSRASPSAMRARAPG